MSSEQDKDLRNACCFVGFDYSHIIYIIHRDMLQLFGKGLIGFLWKYFKFTECIYNCKACLFVLKSKTKKKSRKRDRFFLSTSHSPSVTLRALPRGDAVFTATVTALIFTYPNDFWHKRKMYHFDPYNVLLAIAANIPQRLTV